MSQANNTMALAFQQAGIDATTVAPPARKPRASKAKPTRKIAKVQSAVIEDGKARKRKVIDDASRFIDAKRALDQTATAITTAGWSYSRERETVLALVQSYVDDAKAMLKLSIAFKRGYIADRLVPDSFSLTNAALVIADKCLAAAGTDKKTLNKGQARRTEAQTAAYDAAKMAWSRLTKKAGVKKVDARGGQPKGKSGAINNATAPSGKQAAPAVKTRKDVVMYLDMVAASLLAFSNKTVQGNQGKDAKDVLITAAETSAISDFHAAIKTAHSVTA